MARQSIAPLGVLKTGDSQPGFSIPPKVKSDGDILEFLDVTGGIVQSTSRDKIPANSFKNIVNMRVRGNYVRTRGGTIRLGGISPLTGKVINISQFIAEDQTRYLIILHQDGIRVWDGDGNESTNHSGDWTGTASRVSTCEFLGDFYFTFNSEEGLWRANAGLDGKPIALGELVTGAPSAKYVIPYANRLILLNLAYSGSDGRFPSGVAASADADPDDWGDDSYFTDLIGLGDSISDEITGAAAGERELVIVRKNSIAHLTRQPFSIAPFRVDTIVSEIGSDLHYTTCKTKHGIIFADSRTNDVYLYHPGASHPTSLTKREGNIVKDVLYADLGNALFSEATYDPYEDEYYLSLSFEDSSLLSVTWICNLSRGYPVWTRDSINCSTIAVCLPPPDPTQIDELTGTINNLDGSIDSLSSISIPKSKLYRGVHFSALGGDVIEETYDETEDFVNISGLTSNSERYIESQDIGSPSNYRTLKELTFEVIAPEDCFIAIYLSKDGTTYTLSKNASITGSATSQKVRVLNAQLYGERLFWKLYSVSDFRLLSWWCKIQDGGPK